MPAPPYMPLFVADYLADTTDLTTEQHGAYLLLLMALWRHGGTLPNDPAKLARIARVSPRRWHLVGPAVLEFFDVGVDTVRHGRLETELQKGASLSQKRSAAAKARNSRKPLRSNEPPPANAPAIAADSESIDSSLRSESSSLRSESDSSLRSESSSIDHDAKRIRPADAERRRREKLAEETFERFWSAYPRRVGKGAARKSFTRAVVAGRDPEELIERAARFARRAGLDDPRFVVHPATWLNQERFDDDEEAQHARPGTRSSAERGKPSVLAYLASVAGGDDAGHPSASPADPPPADGGREVVDLDEADGYWAARFGEGRPPGRRS